MADAPSSMLLLGYSSIAERRVVPAARKVWRDRPIDVATRSKSPPQGALGGAVFADYDEALRTSKAELVYVSLPNSMHVEWALKALRSGRHVVIDKPAAMTLADARTLSEEAARRGLTLAEATVFDHHRQFGALDAFIATHGPVEAVTAHFIIPPLPVANFRNHPDLGGGCFLDMSSYAAAVVRRFAGSDGESGEERIALAAVGGGRHPQTGVDMHFSILAYSPQGCRIAGHFGFEGEYENRLTVICRGGSVAIDRVFSPPADLDMVWRQRIANRETVETAGRDDTFEAFLAGIARALDRKDGAHFTQILLRDARLRGRMAKLIAEGAHR